MSASNGNGDEKKPTPDPKQVKAAQEERRRNWLLAGVFIVGALCVLPFTVALFRLLDICGTHTAQLSFYAVALNSALAIAFGGILLCVLLLFYRLRNEETSPSLTSGVIVIAIGAVMAVAISLAARNQTPQNLRGEEKNPPAKTAAPDTGARG